MAKTRNLLTQEVKTYTCSPYEAVIAAHAQENGDFNTWDYEDRYGSLVIEGSLTVSVGNWACFKDGREG